jgi:hypothetical protein
MRTLHGSIVSEYRRLRALDWTAVEAMRAARARDLFEDAEEDGLVRWRCEPEEDVYDEDQRYADLRPSLAKRYMAEDEAIREREGVWIYGVEVRRDASPTGAWDIVDAIGMCVGSIRDTGYDVDLMRSALDALDVQRRLLLPGTWGASCRD